MWNAVKSSTVSVKNHVVRNRAKYAVAVTAVAFISLNKRAYSSWDAFLLEKGIDPMEYYNPEYFAELQQS
jgi:hypothetical protein